ncbi:polyubiquitin-tagged protein recognition complex, Npl4 component [Pholiota conissans]|uniref:Nuclear protein localization protein 4 n=1 Tax=Pholiota conissans TaxID=109636 RepID=A0A9P5Z946_9AGAR|nr:polyubiquitin-tagged protein recognition complex, Npl4 component [Pholiota conissans]
MLIRIRSKDGNFRYDLSPNDDISKLLEKILESSVDPDISSITISNQPRGNEVKISSLKGQTLQKLGLNHGDLVFVGYQSKPVASNGDAEAPSTSTVPSVTADAAKRPWELVKEDHVDVYWRSQSGKIPRQRDTRFCKHALNGMCDYCMPLEPFDAAYHKEHAIKHLSYHAYLRKITPKPSASAASQLPPLNPLSYKVKVPCPSESHPPWPAGICTTCQPSSITLQSQPFRMVDHLEIASMDIIDRFLQAWRKTGLQRFGWLLGRYEPYDKVPMGVKAVVEAIYEPPQQGELDGLTLGWPWEDEARIRHLSAEAATPLTVVGYVFTDLDPTPDDRTKNVYKRHPQSFFLSSLEAIFAATLQKGNPTPSKSSPTGQFASRLVTAVLTATEDGQVDVSAYQVSEQAVAMVEADMIEASVDPGIVRVKEEDRTKDSARYVPDVFFSYKNEYGLEVKKSAKPCFPVEYLLVNVTHGFPQNPSPAFQSTQFAIENRPGIEDQTVDNVMAQLRKLDAPSLHPGVDTYKKIDLAKWLSDWHLIAFLETSQLFSPGDIEVLMRTLSSPSLLQDPKNIDPVLSTDGWQTLMTFTRESGPARPSTSAPATSSGHMDDDIPPEVFDQIAAEEAASRGSGSSSGIRICPHCTFENAHGGTDCEVCGLPLA